MLNLKYYNGKDLYSDGDVENAILKLAESGISYNDISQEKMNWPIFYHLSPQRQNLLSWYPFRENKSLLEIGAGCGALTSMFCKQLHSVTAVELSKRRANIIDARCPEFDNLEIIVGNFNDIAFEQTFDYITLIGVLEYAPSFTDSPAPFVDFLKNIKKLLSDHGKLFIAIENQFGLKYFAGAKEDHLGTLFAGLEGYVGVNKVRTLGKHELTSVVNDAGFKNINFFYPYPDYKFPEKIYSDNFLPSVTDIYMTSPAYDSERYTLFNEKYVFGEILKNNQFPFFANSFLLECE